MIFTADMEQLKSISEQIYKVISEYKYVLFYGELGAGKTTLIRNLAEAAGAPGQAHSPTFSIINTYQADNKRIIHCDLYRIISEFELEQTGFFEAIEDADLVLIEWADKFNLKPLLDKFIEIDIIKQGKNRAYHLSFTN